MTEPTIRRTDSDRRTERNCQSNCWTQPPVRSAKKVTMWERKQILAQIRTEAKLRMEMRGGRESGEEREVKGASSLN